MKPRKLLSPDVLDECLRLTKLGVPNSKIIRDKELDISHPHFAKLLNWWREIRAPETEPMKRTRMVRSLNAPWVRAVDYVQEQPESYTYNGWFPFGHWEEVK